MVRLAGQFSSKIVEYVHCAASREEQRETEGRRRGTMAHLDQNIRAVWREGYGERIGKERKRILARRKWNVHGRERKL